MEDGGKAGEASGTKKRVGTNLSGDGGEAEVVDE